MKITPFRLASGLGVLALVVGITALLSSRGQVQSSQVPTIKIDGSSTVYPITNLIASEFNASRSDKVQVKVDFSGTTGGFRKFCEGTTDISNASRPILKDEMALCNRNNVRYIELPIAFDALTIAVNPQNDWAKDITVAELKKLGNLLPKGKLPNGIKFAPLGQTDRLNSMVLGKILEPLTTSPKPLWVQPKLVAKIIPPAKMTICWYRG
jgi:phosphate transport system substrate-binding protein